MADEEKPAETLAEQPLSLDDVSTETSVEETPKPETEGAGEEEAGEEDKPKKPSGAARAKIKEQRLLTELAQRDREIEELRRSIKPAQDASATDAKPPKEEDFNGDWFAFQRALTAYEAGKTIRDELRKERETRETSERTGKQSEIARERASAHAERVEEARATITDFDEVMAEMKGVNVRNDVIDEIMSSDQSALLSYHLAHNPDKLQALNGMSPRELAREIGRLEASLKMPAAKKKTTAPTPLAPLKGGASGSFDPDKASMDDYVAKRKAGWRG